MRISQSDSVNERLKQFEDLKQKLQGQELQQEITKKLDKLREQNPRIHPHVIKEAIDKMELFIINEDLIDTLD
jgi:hypothetical protein